MRKLLQLVRSPVTKIQRTRGTILEWVATIGDVFEV